jgi:ribosomal protein S27E
MTCVECGSGQIAYSVKLGGSFCKICGATNLAWDEEFGGHDEGEDSELGKPAEEED